MTDNNIQINIKKFSGNQTETTDVSTNGYLLLYLKGQEVKSVMSVGFDAIAPYVLKAAMGKFGGQSQ